MTTDYPSPTPCPHQPTVLYYRRTATEPQPASLHEQAAHIADWLAKRDDAVELFPDHGHRTSFDRASRCRTARRTRR